MQPQTLDQRVERLERRVTTLEELPAHVDALGAQISQLRDEMQAAFSARDIRLDERFQQLRYIIENGNEEIMARARALYEDMVAKLALLQEGRSSRRRPRSTD
jgi:hypothetical protein